MTRDFKLADDLPPNGTLIQASAGTGKTYSVAALVTLAIAEDPALRIGNVLVTTYTRNAAAELRDRIRARMLATTQVLRERPHPGHEPDALDARLLADAAGRAAKAARLQRAVAEFDTATIGTMHQICASVLRMTGIAAAETGDEDARRRTIAEVVNDAIVTETLAARPPRAGDAGTPAAPVPDWNEEGLRRLVEKGLGDPYVVPWYPPAADRPAVHEEALAAAARVVGSCVGRVQERMRSTPSYDDLLRLARDAIAGDDPVTRSFRDTLRGKYRLAIVDEAQDTSRLQWEFLHLIFPPGGPPDDRRLIAVGDPKQAIYGFRGADVTAYLRFAQGGGAGRADESNRRTLRVNRRSDGPLLHGLNAVMEGASFGPGIDYEAVLPADDRAAARVRDLRPVEFVDVGAAALEDAAVAKVYELLTAASFHDGGVRPFWPGEICVLCRTNDVGTTIARRLRRFHIPAVTTGTASVMEGQVAVDMRALLEAMQRPSDAGRARRAAATHFLGRRLVDLAALTEPQLQEIQDRIAAWHGVLQGRGVAAMAGAMLADEELAKRLAEGRDGQRRIVDFAHVVELLHDASGGRGCPARVLLEQFTLLENTSPQDELVSRRIESDEDAVKIMTVHMAKGLQFPAVVVVDGWNAQEPRYQQGPAVFYAADEPAAGERRVDVGLALAGIGTSAAAKQSAVDAANDDRCRMLYVAVTRPQHHVSILRTATWRESLLPRVMPHAPGGAEDVAEEARDTLAVRPAADLPTPAVWTSARGAAPGPSRTAALPREVVQTYRRMSFSTIKGAADRVPVDHHAAEAHGNDEEPLDTAGDTAAAVATAETDAAVADAAEADADAVPAAEPSGLGRFTIGDLPGGTAFGTTVHDIFERLRLGPTADVPSEVREVVGRMATSRQLRSRQDALADMLVDAVHTPFGGPPGTPYRDLRLVDFSPADRLAEMDFEMGVAGMDAGVLASDVGRVLGRLLPPRHPLGPYAASLAGAAFDVPLAGLINGQIDAVLRVPGRPVDDPLLIIADYKTNTLHAPDDGTPLAAYAPHRLVTAMAHAHYPLQALVYGTAVWRLLRGRLGPRKPAGWDPGGCIAGIVYAFVRGMKGADTPTDADGHRYGVFTWNPPPGTWRRLSDLFAGDLSGVRP